MCGSVMRPSTMGVIMSILLLSSLWEEWCGAKERAPIRGDTIYSRMCGDVEVVVVAFASYVRIVCVAAAAVSQSKVMSRNARTTKAHCRRPAQARRPLGYGML